MGVRGADETAQTLEVLRVGDLSLLPVEDGHFTLSPQLLGEEARRHPRGEGDTVRLRMGSFLSGAESTLIDTGLGPDHPVNPTFEGAGLLEGLEARGTRPDDVPHVLFSHLHGDHVGWPGTERGGITFPQAQVYPEAADWEHYWTATTQGLWPGSSTPSGAWPSAARSQLDTEQQVVTGVTAMPAHWHTPGHCVFVLLSAGVGADPRRRDLLSCPAF